MSVQKKLIIPLLLLLILMIGGCSKPPGEKQQEANQMQDKTYKLRISMVITQDDPVYQGYAGFKKGVEARTNGKVSVELYPGGVLGADEDLLEQAMLGGDVGVNSDAGRLGVWVPEIGILLAPYLTDSVEEMQKLVKSDLVKGWLDQLTQKKGLKVLSFNYYTGARHFVTKKPITAPEDLNGLKIRTPGSPVWQETVRSLGATPVALSWTEVYPALQQGVIDGCEAQHPATYGSRLYEVAKYITRTGHIQLWNCLVVGNKWFEQLPKEYQQILLEESLKAGDFTTNKLLSNLKELEDKMTAAGAVIKDVDIEPFKKKTEVVYSKLNYEGLRKEVNQVLGK